VNVEVQATIGVLGSITVDVLTAALTFVSVSVLIKFPEAPPEPLSLFSFVFRLGCVRQACGLSNTSQKSCRVVIIYARIVRIQF
jgi:hypothetical protein